MLVVPLLCPSAAPWVCMHSMTIPLWNGKSSVRQVSEHFAMEFGLWGGPTRKGKGV